MAISVAASSFIALFLESILYGMALTMALATMIILSRTKTERQVSHRPFVLVLCLMLMVATPHIIISFIRKFRAFVIFPEHGPASFNKNIFDPSLNAQNILLVTQTLLGDNVNIWRCYIIYDRKFKYIIIPTAMMLAGAVCGCLLIYSYAYATALETVFGTWARAYEVFIITTNIYCTVAVSWKLYRTAQFQVSGSRVRSAFFVIAETGVVYTSSLVTCLCMDVAWSALLYTAVDIILPLVPCIFCFMILHAHLNRTSASPVVYTIEAARSDDTSPSWMRMRRMLGQNRKVSISATQPVQIQILKEEEEHYLGGDAPNTRKGLNNASVVDVVSEIESGERQRVSPVDIKLQLT